MAAASEEAAVFEVLLDDDVGDSVEDKLDVLRVGGARHVGVDLLHVAAHVELQELHLDVVARVLIRVGPCREGSGCCERLGRGLGRGGRGGPGRRGLTVVVRKADAEVRLFNLLEEDVLLVQEEHYGRGGEVAVVADAVEQVQALVHAVLRRKGAVGGGVARPAATLLAAPGRPASSLRPGRPASPARARTTSSSSTRTMS